MNKYALVTGSSDRIGKAIALDLAQNGYNLILHYNTSFKKIEKVKSEIESLGVLAQTIQINFLKNNDFNKIFLELKNKDMPIEVLINCASDFQPSGFEHTGSDLLYKELKINFENAYLLTKALARIFKKGNIINILDTKIKKSFTTHLDYILSKKLLREFTKLSAVHLAPDIRVNAIAPGLILPPKGKDQNYLNDLANDVPLKTTGSITEVLKAIRFLLDSHFVTGQIIYVDGGSHLL